MLDGIQSSWHRAAAKHALAVLLLATAQITLTSLALGDVRIQGSANALRIDVKDAPISEVLAALGPLFHVRYRSDVPLDKEADGTYRGSLRHVISRLLNGQSYIVKRVGPAIEIVIIDGQQEAAPDVSSPDQQRARRLMRNRNRRHY